MKTLHDPSARASLQLRLSEVQPDATARWGRMSVDQMLWHLNAGLRSALGQTEFVPTESFLSRTVMKWAALYGPWPRGKVETNREMVAGDRYDFHEERGELAHLMEELGSRDLDAPFPRHSVFGVMTGWQWSRLEFRHVDYHLRQFGA